MSAALDDEGIIRPQSGPQEEFLKSFSDICIYGGAAGSGKSYGLLLEAMRYPATLPGFDAVVFRRNTTDIRKPGGLWDETMKVYPSAGAIPVNHLLTWRWPGKGAVKLAHLEYDNTVLDWHGAQVPLICFDELTTFTRFQFTYLMSRNRGMTKVRPYIRASCNADAGSWVAEMIAWWIDQSTGYPIPERSGVIRYFVRGPDDGLIWFDNKLDAMRETGMGAHVIKSMTFIPAKLTDNQILMRNDPQYEGNLLALPRVERERLLLGNWKISPSAGLYFNRSWVKVIDIAPANLVCARGWDLAATPLTATNDPDWTAATKIGRTMTGEYVVLDHRVMRGTPHEVERMLMNTATQDGFGCIIGLPQDPGQAGKAQIASLVTMLAGYPVEFSPETGDKITRFSPFSAQAEVGNVMVLRGSWNERFFTMLEGFPELPHDDDVNSTSRAFQLVAGGNLAEWLRL